VYFTFPTSYTITPQFNKFCVSLPLLTGATMDGTGMPFHSSLGLWGEPDSFSLNIHKFASVLISLSYLINSFW